MVLEALTPGARIGGLLPGRLVTVISAEWHGTYAVTLTFKDDDGSVASELIYRDDEARFTVDEKGRTWSFDADGGLFRLASEARRIQLAHLFDPYLAVHTSNLEPLPHQIQAVYGEMLPRTPLRFLLADDPGAGKTIMAGLLIKELIVRGDLKRCMIVAPGSLVEQWQDELALKLGLEFDIITRDSIEASRSGNPFAEKDLIIARLDQLSRNEDIQAKLQQADWDLIVVDEAHKMSAHFYGQEVKKTGRYQLGEMLGHLTRHLLLMTATPHSGKSENFELFMALIDPDRFEGKPRKSSGVTGELDAQGLMRRVVKEELLTFEGKPLFPERRAYTVSYALSPAEAELYAAVTDYVRNEMNRAQKLKEAGEGRRGNILGFALAVLQRRLASSPEAIYRSLCRRREKLTLALNEQHLGQRSQRYEQLGGQQIEVSEDLDDYSDEELEELEQDALEGAFSAETIVELEAELATLKRLESLAQTVRASGTDAKWTRLAELLQDKNAEMFDSSGNRRKLIIFSEHKDTLNYLTERTRTLLGRPDAVVEIHGGMSRELRRAAQESFLQDPDVYVLVATDAAGEGINLQRAHLLVNYDLPWNPNRIEQRFGRIHRIGQTEVCHMWNLVASGTREGLVYQRLLEKIETVAKDLGGKVFDVLGDDLFEDTSLRDLLIKAVRYGDQPEVRAQMDRVVDDAVGEKLRAAIKERALLAEMMDATDVEAIRQRMEEAELRRLQPFYIRSFFVEAFKLLGGTIAEREPGRFEITNVPAEVRNRGQLVGVGMPVVKRYKRVTFEKHLVAPSGEPQAQLLAPGHPLLDATVDLILERYRPLLKQGATFVADSDEGEEPRALVYLEHAIQNARELSSGQRQVVSKRLQFVEIQESGDAELAGYAPYLDYRPIEPEERALIAELLDADWLSSGLEQAGLEYAISEAVPEHLAEVRAERLEVIELTKVAVHKRLTGEMNRWDNRAVELREKELAGKQPKMNSERAEQRATELQHRLRRRMAELDQEAQLSPLPPLIVGGALVIPRGLLERAKGLRTTTADAFAKETERVERIAVEAVLAAEIALGRVPEEQARNNKGFDIRSRAADGGPLLFIEVKGRAAGAVSFSITKNEVLYALNKQDAYILALVIVDGDEVAHLRYIRRPFSGTDELLFGVTSLFMDVAEMLERGTAPS